MYAYNVNRLMIFNKKKFNKLQILQNFKINTIMIVSMTMKYLFIKIIKFMVVKSVFIICQVMFYLCMIKY